MNGATGSIGHFAVEEEAIRQGHAVRAPVRDPKKARGLPPDDRSPNARGIQNRSLRQYSNDEPHFGRWRIC
jgi:uncharacterized protein YbjT (DUF2867 family)